MSHEGYHEPYDQLTDEVRDMHRAIESLMEQIAKDPRHTIVATAKDEDRVSRRFPSWSMRLFQPGRDPEINLQSIWSDMLSIEALDWPGERSNSIWRCIEKISSTQA